jgi:glycosyltransferase involved in cell wall biosynthesis
MTHTRFSLLLPVYAGDSAAHFAKAFTSSVTDQARRPDDVVVVQDGPISDDLAAAIETVRSTSPVAVNFVRLPQNVGLARALTTGLEHCQHDVVARMDADDISLPSRFERQMVWIDDGYDLVGTGMFEFDESGRVLGRREPPTDEAEIKSSSRFKDPFNHPTVVYRRTAVARAGGYRDLALMEDYWLFARMILSGARVANIGDPLLMYRVDSGAYGRRGGWVLFRSEMGLQRRLLKDGFVTRAQFLRNILIRGSYRFVPVGIRRAAYRKIIARNYTDVIKYEG